MVHGRHLGFSVDEFLGRWFFGNGFLADWNLYLWGLVALRECKLICGCVKLNDSLVALDQLNMRKKLAAEVSA